MIFLSLKFKCNKQRRKSSRPRKVLYSQPENGSSSFASWYLNQKFLYYDTLTFISLVQLCLKPDSKLNQHRPLRPPLRPPTAFPSSLDALLSHELRCDEIDEVLWQIHRIPEFSISVAFASKLPNLRSLLIHRFLCKT